VWESWDRQSSYLIVCLEEKMMTFSSQVDGSSSYQVPKNLGTSCLF